MMKKTTRLKTFMEKLNESNNNQYLPNETGKKNKQSNSITNLKKIYRIENHYIWAAF